MAIDGATFGRVRRHVMKDVASEFDAEGNVYRRQTASGQLHCVEFGTRKWGGAFCVDIGVHFSCVPSFESFSPMRKLRHPQPESCWLHRRWRDEENAQFIDYGETREGAEKIVRLILRDTLCLLDEIETNWGEGRRLLDMLTPTILRADAEVFQHLMKCPDLEKRDQISDSMTIRKRLPGWFPHVSQTCILLAYLSAEFERPGLIPEYLAVTELPGQGHIMLPKTQALVGPLVAHRDNRR